MTPEQQAETRRIVQLWANTTEGSYPGHRALYDLACLLEIERQPVGSREPAEGRA